MLKWLSMRSRRLKTSICLLSLVLFLLTGCLPYEAAPSRSDVVGQPTVPSLQTEIKAPDSDLLLYEVPSALKTSRPHAVDISTLEVWRIERVVDGDTVIVRKDGTRDRLRLLGIDAPESSSNPDLSRQTEEGDVVSDLVKSLVTGRDVYVEFDQAPRDQYGRLLAYIWLDGDVMLNESLVFSGLVDVVRFPPNTAYYRYFLRLKEEAVRRELGFFADVWKR